MMGDVVAYGLLLWETPRRDHQSRCTWLAHLGLFCERASEAGEMEGLGRPGPTGVAGGDLRTPWVAMDRDSGFVPAFSSVSFNLKVEMDINKDKVRIGQVVLWRIRL